MTLPLHPPSSHCPRRGPARLSSNIRSGRSWEMSNDVTERGATWGEDLRRRSTTTATYHLTARYPVSGLQTSTRDLGAQTPSES